MNPRRVVKALIPKKLFRTVEPYGHYGEAVLLNTVHGGSPARQMKVIGVTGTNGKTTTCFLIHRMLHQAGYKVGLMTTVGYGVGDKIKPQIEHMTTLPAPQLIKRLEQIKRQGADWLVMETTSHALAQHRDFGIPYSVAVMTNITHEHLDYHGTFKRYIAAKRLLFERANRNRKGLQTGVINADDPNAGQFISAIKTAVTYGIDKGELRARDIKLSASGVSYTAAIGDDKYTINCQIPGKFNVYNSLAAVGVGRALGLSRKQIEQGITAVTSVEGRMARVDEGQPFEVIVDFAHTPDSFEKLFIDFRPNVKGKLIVLFGSAGRRDEAKRAIQGELAGKYADEVVLTEEDDRDIDGMEILEQIAQGAQKAGKQRDKDLFLVHDRHQAVNFAVSRAKTKDDVVLLLGKGHEKSIAGPDGDKPWDEMKAARAALKDLKRLS
jgi:UDP-N-acetylmuramoyl-L-alanyl-D-glutamate--2,6-diaminopimelate ligase